MPQVGPRQSTKMRPVYNMSKPILHHNRHMMRSNLTRLSRFNAWGHRVDGSLPTASSPSRTKPRSRICPAFYSPAQHDRMSSSAVQRSMHFTACGRRGTVTRSPLQPSLDLTASALPSPCQRALIAWGSTASGDVHTAPENPTAQLPFWKTYISRKPQLVPALFDCLGNMRQQGALPTTIDVAMLFVSSEYLEDYGSLVDTLRQELPGLRNVFGCTGFGVIGVDEDGAREVEAQPAISLTLATLPQAEVVVRHLDETNLPDGDAPPDKWSAVLGVPAFPESGLSVVVLSDPSFSAVQDLLAGLDFAFPTATKIGGLSSSSAFGGSRTATFCWSASSPRKATSTSPGAELEEAPATDPRIPTAGNASGGGEGSSSVYTRGAAVMSIHGEVQMDLMIAQGCRPLSSTTWTVEKVAPGSPTHVMALSSEEVVRGKTLPALEAFQIELQSVLSGMSEVELRRTVANLTVGVAPEGLKSSLEPQDFLIRALRGFDSEQCLVVGEYMRPGQRVRFMVRDKQGAQEDLASHGLSYKRKQLQSLLQGSTEQQAPPFGMLMFTCNGRGSGLYGEDSYDARTMSSYVSVPCAGFQCNGEIGRVGNTTHLHGFTCAVGVLHLTAPTDLLPPVGAGEASGSAAAFTTSSSPAPPPPPPPLASEQSPEQQPEQQ
ncbi:hypothetical protein VaNZ11_009115 [Volvox africanus]|uniref:FIST C-domain domain-containing protein n=1 Tax=Volvox africanus TaxID=51714 RepID=A0ABQ5S6K5_9CHLO|nr:hypothetical protein VaNZ11_009115 [Volvox africanus]